MQIVTSAQMYGRVASLLKDAQHFMLPEGGRVMDDTGRLLGKYSPLLKLLRIRSLLSSTQWRKPATENSAKDFYYTPKRIALCLDAGNFSQIEVGANR